jgi:hypothetical protein
MAPAACALDDAELCAQLARYRAVGADAELVERTRRRLVIRVDESVSDLAVEELVAIEMRCCPFFDLEREQRLRRLSISVSRQEQEPALDAIVYALGFSNAHPARAGFGDDRARRSRIPKGICRAGRRSSLSDSDGTERVRPPLRKTSPGHEITARSSDARGPQ